MLKLSLGGGGMFNAKLLDLISQLTRHVLLDFGNAALITLQGVLSVAFTAVDLLAETLMKAANATRLMAEDVYSIVNSMLDFLGRAHMKGTDITLNSLRWVLSQFSMEMAEIFIYQLALLPAVNTDSRAAEQHLRRCLCRFSTNG